MIRTRTREMERSLRLVREVLIHMSDEELQEATSILENAGFAMAIEKYSRVKESQKVEEPVLV